MTKKLLTLLLCFTLVLAALPITGVIAAGPEVETIAGQITVFLSTFGRVSFEGKPHSAFRTVDDAVAALGQEGGRIIFNGTFDLKEFSTPYTSITFEGTGTAASGNVLSYHEIPEVNILGDTYVSNILISTDPGVPIYTNGHIFNTIGGLRSRFSEKFIENGKTEVTQIAPFTFAVGQVTTGNTLSSVVLSSGYYDAIVAGSHADKTVKANTSFIVGGGTIDKIVSGNHNSTASFEGSSKVVINGGNIQSLIIGSDSGTTNANLHVTLNGGSIKQLYLGANEELAPLNGNIFIEVNSNDIGEVLDYTNNVSGKIILIDSVETKKFPEDCYDYLISTTDTTVSPVYNGTTLSGFRIGDSLGFIPEKVFLNGNEITANNGIFTIPEGKSVITCQSHSATSVNKNASYVNGYSDGTFLPQNNITRAEAITMLARIICEDTSKLGEIANCSYSDVPATQWYAGVIGFFEKLGYLEKLVDFTGTIINPNQYITRAEFAELSRHVLTLITGGREFGVASFADVTSANKFYDAVGQLGSLSIITGYEDGTFRPDNNITRAEAVTIINRMLGRVPTGNSGAISFSDITGHWAYSQIVSACNASTNGDTAVWTLKDDVTKGSYTLLEGEDVTVGDQIAHLRSQYGKIPLNDFITGIDEVSKWQIRNIVNAESEYPENGTVYYVSPNGNNENDGLSPETAWADFKNTVGILGAKKIKSGDTILLERGGEWRGSLSCVAGVTYSAYGTGPKPIINGSRRNYADEELWVETEYPNIYKLTQRLSNVGIMAFNYTGILGNYNELVGTLRLQGLAGVQSYADLRKDLEFYSDLSTSELFLYSDKGNPGERFDNIEIGSEGGLVGVPSPGYVTLDNISFRFTGTHAIGIGGRTDVTVRNCTFDYLGGSVLRGFHGVNTTRYGNALQVYGSCDGWYAYNNWIYQIYDTGITHQYNSPYDKGSATMDNVKYIGNVVELCHWSIEYYNPDYDKSNHTFYNTYIADNICRLNGYGWGSRGRQNYATLFQSAGITANTKNFVTENNIFDRGSDKLINIYSIGDQKLELRNNIYVQKANTVMGNLFGSKWMANDDSATLLARGANDTTSVIVFNNDTSVNDYLFN